MLGTHDWCTAVIIDASVAMDCLFLASWTNAEVMDILLKVLSKSFIGDHNV